MRALSPFQGFALAHALTQRLRAGLLSSAASRLSATAPYALGYVLPPLRGEIRTLADS